MYMSLEVDQCLFGQVRPGNNFPYGHFSFEMVVAVVVKK